MNKKTISIAIIAVIAIVGLLCSAYLFETVEKGTYQVKQAAVTGNMSAKMTPGLWFQMFGDIEPWLNKKLEKVSLKRK